MLKNYITSIWRYVARNRSFTSINILGLVIGITAFMLIAQYVLHELNYDTFWSNHKNVYRVQQDRYDKGELSTRWAAGAQGIGPDMKATFPEVQTFVRMAPSNAQLSYGDVFFKEEGVYYSSKDFFTVFGYPLLEGVDTSALARPNQIVLSKTFAKKYFGDESPLGKTMRNNGDVEYVVTGVFEDLPENTHMKVNALLSLATFARLVGRNSEAELDGWSWDGFLTYVLLDPKTDAKALEAKFPPFVEKEAGEDLKRFNAGQVLTLMPVSNIHLDSNFIMEFKANGSRDTTYFLMVIAILTIIIAWINYINLSTAKSIERAREVGVRKVMGGFRSQLVQQFLIESLLLNTIAVVLSIGATLLITPWFSDLTDRELNYVLFKEPSFWISTFALIFGGAALSGLYPAFVLSAFKPVEVLKGRFKNSGKGILFRKGMVVTQFVASITLIVGTYTVYEQISFMRNQKLGVDVEQTLVVRSPNVVTDSLYSGIFKGFKQNITTLSEVNSLTASSSIPGSSPDWNAGGIRRLSQREEEANQYRVIMMDYDFVKSYGLEVAEGRSFSREFPNENGSVMLNESAAKLMGFENNAAAINDQIFFWGDTFRIVGVLKNYRQESVKQSFEPLVFRYNETPGGYYSIKFNTANVKLSISKFEQYWKEAFPGNPFNYFFLDEHYNQQYKADQQFGKVFGIFSALAIFIACLGLFGLSSLTAIQRTKEIGVRKVLGASVNSILTLVSKDYLVLMGVAIVFATPLTWWIMTTWLESFATRISLAWWIFAVPSLLVVIIAFFTVSIHTLKAARTNPVKSLRYE